jgi:hypothetical protein
MWLVFQLRLAQAGAPVGRTEPDSASSRAGKPVCVPQGMRSEGWAWPDGTLIHWAKCKGVVPVCRTSGAEGEDWYAWDAFIARAACAKAKADH